MGIFNRKMLTNTFGALIKETNITKIY